MPDEVIASSSPRQIGVLMRHFNPTAGGAEAYAYRLVETLAKRRSDRFQFHVFGQSFGPPIDGVVYVQMPHTPWLPRWINQWRYSANTRAASRHMHLVHSHENTSHGGVQTLHVQTVASNLFGPQAKRARWLNALKVATSPRLAFYLCMERLRLANSVVVCASNELKRDSTRHFPTLASSPVIAPATHAPPLAPCDLRAARAALRHTLPALSLVDVNQPWLLFAANDCEKKGLDVLLTALSKLATNVQLLVAGKADQHPKYVSKINELGLQTRVHLLGTVSDMPALYAACDMLVHPTQQDAFPMVVLESMGHGLPVVTTPAPFNGMSAQLRGGDQVLLMSHPSDAGSLVGHINDLLTSTELQTRLRSHAHTFALAHSWDAVADGYHAIFERQLANGAVF